MTEVVEEDLVSTEVVEDLALTDVVESLFSAGVENLASTEAVGGLFLLGGVEDLASTEAAGDLVFTAGPECLALSTGAMADLVFFTEAVGDIPLTKADTLAEGLTEVADFWF